MMNPIMAYRKQAAIAEPLTKIIPKNEGAVKNTISKKTEKTPAHHFRPLIIFNVSSLMISPDITYIVYSALFNKVPSTATSSGKSWHNCPNSR